MKALDHARNFATQYLRERAGGKTHDQAWAQCDAAYNLHQSEYVRRAARTLIVAAGTTD